MISLRQVRVYFMSTISLFLNFRQSVGGVTSETLARICSCNDLADQRDTPFLIILLYMDSNRVKTQGTHSTNQLKALPPVTNSLSQANLPLPVSPCSQETLKKIYFRKGISGRQLKPNSSASNLPPQMSRKKLRLFMEKARETGWNSSFIVGRIPELYPKVIEVSRNSKAKNKETVNPESVREYRTSKTAQPRPRQKLQSQEQPRCSENTQTDSQAEYGTKKLETLTEKDTVSHTKDAMTIQQPAPERLLPRGLIHKRETVYRMQSQYLQRQIPLFHRKIITKLFEQIKSKEEFVLPIMSIRQFREFFDCVNSVITSINQREQALASLMQTLKEAPPEQPQKSSKEQLQPSLLEISMLTLECIQAIVRWREKLGELTKKFKLKNLFPQTPIYEHNEGQNYLKKILVDTEFLHQAKVNEKACFPDPFFLSYNLGLEYEDRDLLYKVRASELFILQQNLT